MGILKWSCVKTPKVEEGVVNWRNLRRWCCPLFRICTLYWNRAPYSTTLIYTRGKVDAKINANKKSKYRRFGWRTIVQERQRPPRPPRPVRKIYLDFRCVTKGWYWNIGRISITLRILKIPLPYPLDVHQIGGVGGRDVCWWWQRSKQTSMIAKDSKGLDGK